MKTYRSKCQQEEKTIYKRDLKENNADLPEIVMESKDEFFRFQDRVEEICRLLENIIETQIEIAGQNGMKLKGRVRKHLEGCDFKGLATIKDPIYPRVAALRTKSYGWVDFVRAIQAIVLVDKGFGELIQPRVPGSYCGLWSSLLRKILIGSVYEGS